MNKNKKKYKKEIINNIIRSIIICIIIIIVIDEHKENVKINENKEEKNIQILNTLYENTTISNNEIVSKQDIGLEEKIIDTYKGYDVVAKLEIPEINLETYVLGEFSLEILNISVTKFWGAEPNEIGNCCIAGHNFRNKNMFHNLKKLKINDKCFLTNNKVGKLEYRVYDIYTVSPKDVNCLSQNTRDKELTLITCTNDSKNRLIVKAKQI